MNKKVKVAIITFLVLGITGIAIIKGREMMKKKSKNKNKKSAFDQLFELPQDLQDTSNKNDD